MSKSSSSSHKKTTSLESVSSELDLSDLADDLYYDISNDNHKNPFSTAIDLYGNTGGEVSSTTYTIPIRNADGMFLDDSDNELYVLVRYKSDPTPITSITLSYS
mgnify:CR=1 FL=1